MGGVQLSGACPRLHQRVPVRIGRSPTSALWQSWAEKCDRTSGTEDGESAPKNHRMFAIEGEYNTAISVVERIRFAVGFIVQTRQRPPEHCSFPSLAWPLAEISCVAIATSIGRTPWLMPPSPTPSARLRTDLPACRACSLSARGGRWRAGRLESIAETQLELLGVEKGLVIF